MTYNSQRYFAAAYFPRYFQSGRLRWINGDVVRLGREYRLTSPTVEARIIRAAGEMKLFSLSLELKMGRPGPMIHTIRLNDESRIIRMTT